MSKLGAQAALDTPVHQFKDIFLTDIQLAHRWAMSPKTLRNLRVSGASIRFVRIGRLVRYRLDEVLAWEAAHTCRSTADRGGAQ